MRRFFFLPREFSYGLLIILIYTLWNLDWGYKILVSLIVGLVGFAFRRSNLPYRDTLKNDGEIYLSPIHGEVRSIRKDIHHDGKMVHEIRISMAGWSEKGLYLPTTGEVTYLRATKGAKISRDSESQAFYGPMDEVAHTDLTLTSKNQTKTLMRFVDCKYSQRPIIWLKSGDRGRGAATFGYYPFGGTLLIYVPNNSDILVFEKEKVVPGQTVIAALKDQ